MGGERSGDEPYFFLSYARTPRPDHDPEVDPDYWVHKLYDDLCGEVLALIKSRVAGFMDREIKVGAQWSTKVTKALAACRVFVPLYSPRYFASENCGKEWYAFSRRVLDQRAREPGTEMAIVPALWTGMDEEALPNVAREIQFNHHDLSERYIQHGFIGIMKVGLFKDDYMLALQGLARRIVEVAKTTDIDPGRNVDFATSESAFGDTEVHQMPEKRMQLTVVTFDVGHLPKRRDTQYYGRTPREWRPYFPSASMPIIDYALELAHYLGCKPAVISLQDHLRDAASGAVAPGLFLIDCWAAMSQQYRADLRSLDQLDQYCTSVLHPCSEEDGQSVKASDRLRTNLESCLPHKVDSIPHRLRRAALRIETIEDFGDVMAPMIMTMRRRFLQQATPYPPQGTATKRPRLTARDDDDDEGTR